MTDRQQVIAELCKPFPRNAIEKKGKFDYVSGETVIYRLNAATNYDWAFEITGHEMVGGANSQGNKPALVVYGRMRIPIVSDGWRADMGTQLLENMPDDHEAHKGAVTDCIKRCARLFGVGLHLWGVDIEAGARPVQQQSRPHTPHGQAPRVQREMPQDAPQRAQPVRQQYHEGETGLAHPGFVQNGTHPDLGGPPMTDRQRGFLISLAKELGMVSDNGHHDAAALDAEIREFFRDMNAGVDTLTVGKAKEVIDEFVIRRDAARSQPVEPHPMVQQAMESNTANWIAAMEGAANISELSRRANEAIAANAMTDPVRAIFNKRRDLLQDRALVTN